MIFTPYPEKLKYDPEALLLDVPFFDKFDPENNTWRAYTTELHLRYVEGILPVLFRRLDSFRRFRKRLADGEDITIPDEMEIALMFCEDDEMSCELYNREELIARLKTYLFFRNANGLVVDFDDEEDLIATRAKEYRDELKSFAPYMPKTFLRERGYSSNDAHDRVSLAREYRGQLNAWGNRSFLSYDERVGLVNDLKSLLRLNHLDLNYVGNALALACTAFALPAERVIVGTRERQLLGQALMFTERFLTLDHKVEIINE